MSFDPLSGATRAAKRNLLVVSSILICIKIFDIRFDKIPFSGIDIQFDQGDALFSTCALVLYLLLEFSSYYLSDLLNNDVSSHESKVMAEIESKISNLKKTYSNKIRKTVEILREDNIVYYIREENMQYYYDLLEKYSIKFSFIYVNIPIRDFIYIKTSGPNPVVVDLYSVEDSENYKKLIAQYGNDASMYKKFLVNSNRECEELIKVYPVWYLAHIFLYAILFMKRMYVVMFRTYVFDGMVPVAFAVLSIMSSYDLVNLRWVKSLGPV